MANDAVRVVLVDILANFIGRPLAEASYRTDRWAAELAKAAAEDRRTDGHRRAEPPV